MCTCYDETRSYSENQWKETKSRETGSEVNGKRMTKITVHITKHKPDNKIVSLLLAYIYINISIYIYIYIYIYNS